MEDKQADATPAIPLTAAYLDFISTHGLDPAALRGAWAFCLGNPWQSNDPEETAALADPEMRRLADELADLTRRGIKTATTSALIGYKLDQPDYEPLPAADGKFDLVLNSSGDVVCAIRTTRVYRCTFDQASADHAYKEGEGDRTLAYWREVHENFFRQAGVFSPDMELVCEEFEVV